MSKFSVIAPDEGTIARGAKFSCHIDRHEARHKGVVRDEHGDIRWYYFARKDDSGRSRGNPFNKKLFVVADPQTGEEIVLRRVSFFPSRFTMIKAGGEIGTVRMKSVLRNKYTIIIDEAHAWTFRMPLFTNRFWGGTEASPEFWVTVGPSKMDWNILIKPGIADQPLIAALSFIHNEWWNYS